MTSPLLPRMPEDSDDDLARLADQTGRFLSTGPTPTHVCRFLVLTIAWSEGARGALIALCQDDGHIEIAGSFGYPRSLMDTYRRLSLFDHTPLTDAITQDSALSFPDPAKMVKHNPSVPAEVTSCAELWGTGGLIAVPLMKDAGPVGVLGMNFSVSVARDSVTLQQLATLRPLLTMHLSLTTQLQETSSASGSAGVSAETPAGASLGLTTRQMLVLQMLAKRMTNPQIAEALDYSLSTVRLDTMAIYRALGAEGRRDAVDRARAMGLITGARPRAGR